MTKQLLESALAFRRAGRWEEALRVSEQAFASGLAERSPEDAVEALLIAAHSYREMSRGALAIEQFELAESIAILHDNARQAGRSLNGKAIVLQQKGSMDEAEVTYHDAKLLALSTNDDRTVANVQLNLGTLHTVRGDVQAASDCYESSLAIYERLSDDRGVLGVLNNLGMLLIDSRDLDAADEALSRAVQIARKLEDDLNEGVVQLNRCELNIRRGELAAAREMCDSAFEVFARLGDFSGLSDALKHYGTIYRESAKPYLAETHLREAIAIASRHSHPLQEAEAHRELALVLQRLGRNREALAALNRSSQLFELLQASTDQADIAGRLLQLQQDFMSVVVRWGESIDEKDQYTSGHCHRVAAYTRRVAEALNVPAGDLIWLTMGAFLHDVGKTRVPAEVLQKPANLTSEERVIMESHTLIGERILSEIAFPWDVQAMARSHHERWDGNGYPDGLIGVQIPLPARILHVADVYDALTTVRSYRNPVPMPEALAIMRQDADSFDPEILTLFEGLCESGSITDIDPAFLFDALVEKPASERLLF